MFFRSLAAFLALPGTVAGLLPLWILRGNLHPARTGALGIALLAAGFLLLVWCARDFHVSGRGTLAPWDPPKRLVVVGLYRFIRNPMYVAVLTLVAGWGFAFGSLSVGAYFLILAVGFHLRVLFHEEPWLRRQFGAEWERYSRTVPRWMPRLGPGGNGSPA